MKKNILIFIICVLSCNLYAQRHRKDLEHIIHWIDSMTVSLSIEQNKDIRGFVPFYNSQLNVREKTKLVGKIRELFEQNEYSNLYKLGHEIIREMWEYIYNDTNSFEIKQMLTELYLQYYFHPGAHKIVNSYDIRSKSYYNKKAKERIKEILEDKKTKEEYNACFLNNKSILLKSKSIWMEASEIMKQRENRSTEILKQIRDSVLTYKINKWTKDDFESIEIEPELIKMVGLLNMKECIPALKERLLACPEEEYRIQERAYRYALARLGDKEQRQYILDNFMDIDLFYREDFIYFKDDEMIWKYIETNYFSDTPAYSEFSTPIPTSLATINNIYPYVKNVPKDVEYPSVDTFEELSDWSKIFYQWLMANKESIKFDYDGEKDWSFWK